MDWSIRLRLFRKRARKTGIESQKKIVNSDIISAIWLQLRHDCISTAARLPCDSDTDAGKSRAYVRSRVADVTCN